jgi:Ca-activated chloride channel family protein
MKLKKFYVFILILILAGCSKYDEALIDDGLLVDIIRYGDQYEEYSENPFVNTSDEAVSTFAINADGRSYSNCKRYIMNNEYPPTSTVHIEEFINYFSFDYKEPQGDNPLSIESELSVCPWNTEHHLLRVGIKGEDFPIEQLQGSNIVLLVDISGSMSADDKLPLLRESFKLLLNELSEKDNLSIVTYSANSKVHLEPISCAPQNREAILEAINGLIAGGDAEGAEGISTAYQLAEDNFIQGGNNRIILATDDNFNLGINDNNTLTSLIEGKKEKGIFLSVLGSGRTNHTDADAMLEQLAQHGNGYYEYIGDVNDAVKIFQDDFKKFYTVAQDVSVELSFDSERVKRYRLIGYKNRKPYATHVSPDEEAGEIGCDQSITALYELVMNEDKSSVDLGNMTVNYKKLATGQVEQLESSLNIDVNMLETASESQMFAASVACFGMILKQSQYHNQATVQDVLDWSSNAMTFDPNGYRAEFIDLVTHYKGL